jgi:hypothetical protein
MNQSHHVAPSTEGSPGWTVQRTLPGMAGRSWATSIATTIGVAAGAGAAQLGIGYGLGVISWQDSAGGTTTWFNSLTWVTWLAGTSTVIGALVSERLVGDEPHREEHVAVTFAWKFVIALAAAVGALITVPLVALPSRTPRPDNVAPYFTTGGYAVAGVIVGALVALAAISVRAVAANIITWAAWVWALAVVVVADVVRSGGDVAGSAQLGAWQFAGNVWVRGVLNLPGALLMIGVALIIGFLAAWPGGRRGDNRLGVGISGAAGPVLVAIAYFFAGPVTTDSQHMSAFYIAPWAVLAGLGGSVLVALIGPKGYHTQMREERRAAQAERTARDASQFTDWTHALAEAERAANRDEDRFQAGQPEPAPDKESDTVPVAGPDSREDVEDDAYAPSRAYGAATAPTAASRAYAEDTVEPEPPAAGGTATATATGRAEVKQPLWPDQERTEATTEAADKSKRRFRKG